MPIWVKCIFFFWLCFAVMHCLAMIFSDEIHKRTRLVKIKRTADLPWYLIVYALSFLICLFSIIPIGIWLIFLR